MLIPMLCEPVWDAFVSMGAAAGTWRNGPWGAKYMPPRNEPIDDKKDTDAELAAMNSGLEAWSDVVTKRGKDPKKFAELLQADDELLSKHGLQRMTPGAARSAAPDSSAPTGEENDE